MFSFLQPPKPFHLESVIKTHGWFQLVPFYWKEKEKQLYWAEKLPGEKPLLLCLSQKAKNGRIRIDTFGRSLPPSLMGALKDRLRYIFQMDVDLSGFYALAKTLPSVREVKRRGMGRIMRAPRLFEDLVKAICGTNCTWKQAVKMINRIGELGQKVPGAGEYRVFPNESRILKGGVKYLKDKARLGYRAESIIQLCKDGRTRRREFGDAEQGRLNRDALEELFLSIRGIGKITTRYLLALHGHFDRLAVDSLGISYMAKTHFKGQRPTPRQVEALFDSFGRWKYLVYWMEFILSEGWVPEGRC